MSTVSKIAYTKAGVLSPAASERHRKRPLVSTIAQMSDDEIICASFDRANYEVKQSKTARAHQKWPLIFSAVTSIACGALKKGSLANKLASGAVMGASLLAAFATVKAGEKIALSIENTKAEKENRERKNYPSLVTYALTCAALCGAMSLGAKGIKKAGSALAKKFAPAAMSLQEKIAEKADKINKGKAGVISDSFTKKISQFSENHPKATKFANKFGFIGALLSYVGADVLLVNKIRKERNENAVNNMNKLVLCRDFAQDILDLADKADED